MVVLPKRPPLRYHGSKWRAAKKIRCYFAPLTCYVEPFAGGAGVLLQKPPVPFEVYNDLDNQVVNFFDVLRSQAGELIRAIELTPYSLYELKRAYDLTNDPLEDARRFYLRCWQQHHPGRGRRARGLRKPGLASSSDTSKAPHRAQARQPVVRPRGRPEPRDPGWTIEAERR